MQHPESLPALQPGDLLAADELAALLDVSTITLANWRSTGKGPRFVKVGKRMVRYHRADVMAFIEAGEPAKEAA